MAQFFSSTPIDYGADAIARGYQNFADGISKGIYKRAENRREVDMVNMQEALLAKRRQAEAETQFANELAGAGVAPIRGADGSIDRVASGAALVRAKQIADLAKQKAAMEQASAFELSQREKAAGIGAAPGRTQGLTIGVPQMAPAPAQGRFMAPNPFGVASQPQASAPVDPTPTMTREQAVAQAERRAALDKYKQEREIAAEAEAELAKGKEGIALKTLKAEADARGIDVNSKEGKDWLGFQLELARVPTDQKYAMLTVDDMAKAGLVKNDRAAIERERARLLQFGGKVPSLSPAQIKNIEDENSLVRNLGSVQKAVDGFEQKYGAGAFDKYVGEIDKRTNEWKLRFNGPATEADKEAGRIAQMFQSVFNADLKATSGGAVTESEAVRTLQAAGALTGANFKNSLQGWRDARITGLRNKQKVLGNFAVPAGLFNYEDETPQPAQSAPTVNSVTAGGASWDDSKQARLEELRRKAAGR